jgi:hypothetical protein
MLGDMDAYFLPPGHPGEIDFRSWLAERTPPHAPALVVAPPDGGEPFPLPQIRPPSLAPGPPRGRRRRGAAPALQAAFMLDLEGLTHRQLADSGLLPFSTERAARQHVRDGRFVAAELGLWPWAVVGGQALARHWWIDDRFARALGEWAMREPLAIA